MWPAGGSPVREAILRIARDNLAPTGVAFISYNVLPGWRLRQTLRDAMALHTPPDQPLRVQIARSRELLAFLEQHTPAETTWGRIFRSEAAQLRQSGDYYIAHEFLEQCNEPCSFSEFMRDAEKSRLAYLGEAEVFTMMPENMNPAAAPLLRMGLAIRGSTNSGEGAPAGNMDQPPLSVGSFEGRRCTTVPQSTICSSTLMPILRNASTATVATAL